MKKIVLMLLCLCQQLGAYPIYENIADSLGLSHYQDNMVVMKDSRESAKHYIIPTQLSSLESSLDGELPSFILNSLNLTYEELNLGQGRSEFIFFLAPNLKLHQLESISKQLYTHHNNWGLWVAKQSCYNPKLSLNSIPQSLIENVRVYGADHVLQHDINQFLASMIKSMLPLLPSGFLYKFTFETTNPQLVRKVLSGIGFIGNATFQCQGYTKDMDRNGAPETIDHSVLIQAHFR